MNNKKLSAISFMVSAILIAAIIFLAYGIYDADVRTKAADEQSKRYLVNLQELYDLAHKTSLTGLLTLDAFMETLEPRFEAGDFGGVSAFVSFDGDNMGKLNETYGQSATNRLVYEIGLVVKKYFPENENNIVCNVGDRSDEFYMMLTGRSSKEELLAEVEAMQQGIRDIEVLSDDGRTVKGTVSVGIAFYGEDEGGTDFNEMFENSDSAAYAAKEAGKDCYRVYGEEE